MKFISTVSGFTSDQQPRNIMFNSAYFRIVVDL